MERALAHDAKYKAMPEGLEVGDPNGEWREDIKAREELNRQGFNPEHYVGADGNPSRSEVRERVVMCIRPSTTNTNATMYND